MPKKRSQPMPPLYEISQDYGGIEAGLSQFGTARRTPEVFAAWLIGQKQSSTSAD